LFFVQLRIAPKTPKPLAVNNRILLNKKYAGKFSKRDKS
jgi:transcription termination factor NusB